MNDLMVFDNSEFGRLEVLTVDGKEWFPATRCARMLGYIDPHDAIRSHCKGVGKFPTPTKTGVQMVNFITEGDLFRLIVRSTLPKAEKIERWIFDEVLPAIRKTGGYNMPQLSQNEIIAQIAQANVDFEKRINTIEEKQSEQFSLLEEKMQESQEKIETTLKVFSSPNIDHWKDDINQSIDIMVETHKLSPVAFRGKLYKELESNGIMLQSRLSRLRTRMKKQGMTYKDRLALTKLDAISKDKQLRAIFEGIVKRYQALYSVQKEAE